MEQKSKGKKGVPGLFGDHHPPQLGELWQKHKCPDKHDDFTAHQWDLENAKTTAAEAHLTSLKLTDKNNIISQMFVLPRNIILTKSSYFVNSLSLLNCSPSFINSIGALNFYNSFCSTEKIRRKLQP